MAKRFYDEIKNSFIEYHGQKKGGYVLIMATEIDKPHSCYDKYNGKNLA